MWRCVCARIERIGSNCNQLQKNASRKETRSNKNPWCGKPDKNCLTIIESKEDHKLLQSLITAISEWENQRWTGLVKYHNKVGMLLCYHRQWTTEFILIHSIFLSSCSTMKYFLCRTGLGERTSLLRQIILKKLLTRLSINFQHFLLA